MPPLGVRVLFTLVATMVAGPSIAARFDASAWAIVPEETQCHTDFELVARSGAVAPVALVSDGERVSLRFTKEGVPTQAFLPLRIDQKPYSNLVQRTGDEGLAVMGLSDETLAALRHGKTLQIAWLTDEAMSASLSGASQGIADLKTCGVQVSAQYHAREAQREAQRARAVAEEQLAAAQAVRRKATAEAEQLTAQAAQQRAAADAERQRTIADRQRASAPPQYYYYDERHPPPPDPYVYYRPYYYPR